MLLKMNEYAKIHLEEFKSKITYSLITLYEYCVFVVRP